jgi:hypothetical protein
LGGLPRAGLDTIASKGAANPDARTTFDRMLTNLRTEVTARAEGARL